MSTAPRQHGPNILLKSTNFAVGKRCRIQLRTLVNEQDSAIEYYSNVRALFAYLSDKKELKQKSRHVTQQHDIASCTEKTT
jgi:hypothetical protein